MSSTSDLLGIPWDEYDALSIDQKAARLDDDGTPYHILMSQQFDRDRLDRLGELATRIRQIAKSREGNRFLKGLLFDKRAMLYFTQPSSRTFLSFSAACQILGLETEEVRDTATSSELKGETQEDSVRTFSSYFDLIVMRTKLGGLAEKTAWMLSNAERSIPIINAGSGADQHPTQALLDIYTLQRSFEKHGGIDGKHIVFVGDMARGRTVRSLACLLTCYSDVKQTFVAPESLQVGDDIKEMLRDKGVAFAETDSLDAVVADADAVYMTRIQDEWDDESRSYDLSNFCFGTSQLEKMKEHAVVMHPLPRREELSTEVDHDPRAVYWRQMRNGMWVRAALIATIFKCEPELLAYND